MFHNVPTSCCSKIKLQLQMNVLQLQNRINSGLLSFVELRLLDLVHNLWHSIVWLVELGVQKTSRPIFRAKAPAISEHCISLVTSKALGASWRVSTLFHHSSAFEMENTELFPNHVPLVLELCETADQVRVSCPKLELWAVLGYFLPRVCRREPFAWNHLSCIRPLATIQRCRFICRVIWFYLTLHPSPHWCKVFLGTAMPQTQGL